MGRFPPGEEALEAILEDEDYSNSENIVNKSQVYGEGFSYLALKRRKLLVINGSEKLGLLIYFEDRTSGGSSSSSTSSSGMTCCNSLRRRRLARHIFTTVLIVMFAYLVRRRSCREYP